MADQRSSRRQTWPPPPAVRRTSTPPQRHARWVDREHTADEPREDSPKLLWWVLGGILIFAVFSVMIRMFLVL